MTAVSRCPQWKKVPLYLCNAHRPRRQSHCAKLRHRRSPKIPTGTVARIRCSGCLVAYCRRSGPPSRHRSPTASLSRPLLAAILTNDYRTVLMRRLNLLRTFHWFISFRRKTFCVRELK